MAIQDDAKQFFLTELSRSQGDLPSLQLEWLASEGYTRGSIDERWSYYLRDNGQPPTGVSWDLLGLTRNKGGGDSFVRMLYGQQYESFADLAKIANAREAGRVYYVDPAGNDTDPGIEGSPWATLNKVATVFNALSAGQTMIVRGLSAAAWTGGQLLSLSNANAGASLILSLHPGSSSAGVPTTDASFLDVGGNAWMDFIAPGFTIEDYDTGTGNGLGSSAQGVMRAFGGDGAGGRGLIRRCVDGWSMHNDSVGKIYGWDIKDCSKSAFAHINASIGEAHDCSFTGKSGASAGIGTNPSSNAASFVWDNCDFIPATAGQSLGQGGLNRNCRIGTLSLRVDCPTLNAEDSFIHIGSDARFATTLTRCYGKAAYRVRGVAGSADFVARNCVFAGGATGAAVSSFLYANFDDGLGNWDGIDYDLQDCIFTGYTAAACLGQGFNATHISTFNANSRVANCVVFGNTGGINASITSDTDIVTSDPDIGAANTLVQSDYGYAPGSPCIGAGFGGGNIGFAA